ncbi:hypothetical protein BDV26DRAFT_290511 [Aspergillus bertholletiae]|uniref:Uncharacterized protein n=1 Tax=Aspergillus bertholletiae TaxID=1226010 RepID=A0A5N7BEU6_9EURO|nr:hypothetical protein BDV26DRAFT_290511 [Aspergillus bertholletiae]
MYYVYYASLYTVWALLPDGAPDRLWWVRMAAFLEECLRIIQFGGDDRFKIKKVNPIADEGYETGDEIDCENGFRGCVGDEYSEDEGMSDTDVEYGINVDDDEEEEEEEEEGESELETVIDDEEHMSNGDEQEAREDDVADQNDEIVREMVNWDHVVTDEPEESPEERLRLDAHGHGHRGPDYRAWVLKNHRKYGTTFRWDDQNGEPTLEDVRYQLWQKVSHDLREIDANQGGRVYTKPALRFR